MKQRYINTKLWSDNWITNLDPVEKLLFIYLLTNERTTIAGIYELPVKIMAVETGVEKEMIEKVIERFSRDGKVVCRGNWIMIVNFIKHQSLNPKMEKGVAYILQRDVPEDIKKELYGLNPSLEYFEDVYLPETGRQKGIRNIIKGRSDCEDCGEGFNKQDLVVHHIKPIFRGGSNDRKNLAILCSGCHKERHKIIGYDTLSNPSNYSNRDYNSNSIRERRSLSGELTPSKEASLFFEDPEFRKGIIKWFIEKGIPAEFIHHEIPKFVSYWSELNKSGTKQKWEIQKTFEVKRRLNTWFLRASQYGPQKSKINATIIQ